MHILESVLREKRLRRTQRMTELAEVRGRCEASAQERSAAQRAHEEARAFLWHIMTGAEICIQRLSAARLQDDARRQALDNANRVHASNVQRAGEVEQLLARLEKDIEKLIERQEESRRASVSDNLKRQWRDLDDWALSRRGRTT